MELKINSFLQLDCISGDKPGVTASLQFFYVNSTGSGEVRRDTGFIPGEGSQGCSGPHGGLGSLVFAENTAALVCSTLRCRGSDPVCFSG